MSFGNILPPLHLLIFFLFSVCSQAEIRYTQIRSQNRTLHLIDEFGFTQTGHLQLNLSHISFSNPNPNLFNFSHVGFFFSPRLVYDWMDLDDPNRTQVCYLQSSHSINIVYTFNDHHQQQNSLDVEFPVSNLDIFNFYFQNCLPQLQVSMDIRSAMYNLDHAHQQQQKKNYLSVGKNSLFKIYFIYILIYLCFALLWLRCALHPLRARAVFPIHNVILLFVVFKVLGFVTELVNLYYLKNVGYSNTLLIFFTSVSGLFSGVDLYALVGLISSGWSILKGKMKFQNKILLAIVISVRVFANALKVVNSVRSPCGEWCIDFGLSSCLLDMIAFPALISPIVCIIWHLLTAGQVEGKAALSLRKVKMFRHFFFFVLFYGLSCFIFNFFEIYALTSINYWVGVVVGESKILALYVFIGYKFRPEVRNKTVLVFNYDEEMNAIEALKDEKAYDLTPHGHARC